MKWLYQEDSATNPEKVLVKLMLLNNHPLGQLRFMVRTARNAPVRRERFHYDWHWQSPYGNGDIGNQGPHQMDVARWAIGKENAPQTCLVLVVDSDMMMTEIR